MPVPSPDADLDLPMRSSAGRHDTVARRAPSERGGHPGPLEEPGLLTADFRASSGDGGAP